MEECIKTRDTVLVTAVGDVQLATLNHIQADGTLILLPHRHRHLFNLCLDMRGHCSVSFGHLRQSCVVVEDDVVGLSVGLKILRPRKLHTTLH